MKSLIFVSIYSKNSGRIPLQNKVALRFDPELDDPESVAKEFFNDICKMDNMKPENNYYEILRVCENCKNQMNCSEFHENRAFCPINKFEIER